MLIKFKLLTLVLVVILVCAPTPLEGARRKTTPLNEEQEQQLKQSQSTFVQWVLSLIPQRPSFETLTGSLLGTTPTTATDQTAATSTLKPEKTTKSPDATGTTVAATPAPSPTSTLAPSTTTAATTPSPAPILDPPRTCPECFCGIANTQKRIVGGQETEIHQYPWMTMLLYGGRFYCAGSLINDQYIVTASHCVYGFRKERISVRLLEHNRKMSNFQKIDRNVTEIITHPKYNARTYDNDIAIIKLNEPVEMTELLHPVCMPTPGKSFKGELGTVTGWGALKVGGPTSETLQVSVKRMGGK